jgi:hypothetical protein
MAGKQTLGGKQNKMFIVLQWYNIGNSRTSSWVGPRQIVQWLQHECRYNYL